MRTIIAGSRTLGTVEVCRAMRDCGWTPTIVLSGTAQGVDRAGELWAHSHHIPVERYPADWNTHGRSAGMIRNAKMADRAEALVAVWDGVSKGTRNMIKTAMDHNLKVFVMDSF